MNKTKITTMNKLREFINEFDGSDNDLNTTFLRMMRSGLMDEDIFIEYLELTQMTIHECFEEEI